jgi:hypothetical protein
MNRKVAASVAAQLLLPALCYAHQVGQVDSRGCHEDRRRGNYHCHVGPYAGLTFTSVADLESQIKAGKTVAEMRKEQGKDGAGKAAESDEGGWLSKVPFYNRFFGSSKTSDTGPGTLIVPQGIEQRLSTLKDLHDKGLVTDQEYEAKRKEILGDL